MPSRNHGTMIFAPGAPKLFTIPPHARFLDALAGGFLAGCAQEGLHPADATIILPSRRAGREMALALYEASGEAGLIAPRLRSLAEFDDEAGISLPDAEVALALPPVITPLQRLWELAKLCRDCAPRQVGRLDLLRSLRAAQALITLLDSAAIGEKVDWHRLPGLVADRDLAEHWAASADFLAILAEAWPARLAKLGLMEPANRQAALVSAWADGLTRTRPDHPVILAGSTGTAAATRRLMQAILGLPRGIVVLPGLDQQIEREIWTETDPQHPQYAFRELLDAFGLERTDVALWPHEPAEPGAGPDHNAPAERVWLLNTALRPPEAAADWRDLVGNAEGRARSLAGLAGLSRVMARDESEATAIAALYVHKKLAEGTRRIAIVTPEYAGAQMVAMRLRSMGLDVHISAGAPFGDSRVGGFLRLLLALAGDPAAPDLLAALLTHPLCRPGIPDAEMALARADSFRGEILRGPRRAETLAALAENAEARDAPLAARLFRAIARALAPLTDPENFPAPLPVFAGALAASAEAMTTGPEGESPLWTEADGELAADLLATMIAQSAEVDAPDDQVERVDMAPLWDFLTQGLAVAPIVAGDRRIEILGPLEARFTRADAIALVGLDEGSWPRLPAPDPFLSRAMRKDLGLPSPEARIGLAARDFVDMASAPQVLLVSHERREDRPALASRWLWRLDTLVGAGEDPTEAEARYRGEGAFLAHWAERLASPSGPIRIEPPAPRPPANARLTRLSVTEAEWLIRDPYALYARRILRLRPLRAFGAPMDAALRGTAIHAAIEDWVAKGRPDGDTGLLAALISALHDAGFSVVRAGLIARRLEKAVNKFARWDAARIPIITATHIERKGELPFAIGEDRVILSARADRVDILDDGRVWLLDIKTGQPPGDREIRQGLAPQLPLEAAMLMRGAFPDIGTRQIAGFSFWRFAGSEFGEALRGAEDGHEALADAACTGLTRLLHLYAAPEMPFRSSLLPKTRSWRGDYDLLARRAEWAAHEGGDEE